MKVWRGFDLALSAVSILLVRAYRLLVAPWLGPRCRFYPTCSAYMEEAIRTHGFFKGTRLGIVRLCKCHPWHPGGDDPVPGRR
jgi:uncharacterized protein